jgi:hypothetical protein
MEGNKVAYPKIKYWVDHYGSSGADDKKGAELFVTCETAESIVSLRSELISMSKGNFNQSTIDVLIGLNRRHKHGSFENWAKMMLLWLAAAVP